MQHADFCTIEYPDVVQLMALFDLLPDVVFFCKDHSGRYQMVNETLRVRCGCCSKQELIGRLPEEVFPLDLGASYASQDQQVIRSGVALNHRLEVHIYPDLRVGWCVTHKRPLRDRNGVVTGLVGISRDLRSPNRNAPTWRRVASSVEYLTEYFGEVRSIQQLATIAQLSLSQYERAIQQIFELTPKQLLIKTRIDASIKLLAGNSSIAAIAASCGYADHSAFSRQFRQITGLNPRQYRQLLGRDA
ncbi:HTH-type transcriptional activator RhaS [Herpetosiphon gulosus]|uniref:HTH-type transcriptional activator RhaS n=2 Tax=Herpetosiphon gulosus TaxID=1973496 RepID=A0ABP9X3U8_9CHLR